MNAHDIFLLFTTANLVQNDLLPLDDLYFEIHGKIIPFTQKMEPLFEKELLLKDFIDKQLSEGAKAIVKEIYYAPDIQGTTRKKRVAFTANYFRKFLKDLGYNTVQTKKIFKELNVLVKEFL